MMHDHGKSDGSIVPGKPSNKAGQPAAEGVEERDPAKGNPDGQNRSRTQHRATAGHGNLQAGTKPETADTDKRRPTADCDLKSALDRIRVVAGGDRKKRFTSLFHHVCRLDNLEAAYRGLKRKAAPGVDGQTWKQYGESLQGNLHDLRDRLRRGAFRAKPVRRVFIPKPDGRQRPLGVTSLEDKIVQRATVTVLNTIYETDFLDFSHGYRPGRSPHHALDALHLGLTGSKVNFVLDADIQGFFDSISHEWLVRFIEHRIADPRIVRLIQKWLKAGVLEEGKWRRSEEGTPQGGSISPLLANIYLHYVFDLWAVQWARTQADGEMIAVRFADDLVVGFRYRSDAERFRNKLVERFRRFNLELHSGKTRLIEFGRFAAGNRKEQGLGKPDTFDFLGFTHICAKTRGGRFVVARQTIRKRLRAKLAEVKEELRRRLHWSIAEVGQWLRRVLTGHFAYYGVPLNSRALNTFRWQVGRLWLKTLRRRSQKARFRWTRMTRLIETWLPPVRLCHPWPSQRQRVTT